MIQNVVGDHGLDILCNNAGIVLFGPIEWQSVDVFRRTLEVNLIGHINVTKAALPVLKIARGRIINVSSFSGRMCPHIYCAAYNISKYGLEAFSDSLRLEMKPWGVSVHIVEPNLCKTDIYRQGEDQLKTLWNELSSDLRASYGESFYKTLLERANPSAADAVASNPKYVVDAYVDAALSTRPLARYLVGSDANEFVYSLSFLPEWLGDCIEQRRRFPPTPESCTQK